MIVSHSGGLLGRTAVALLFAGLLGAVLWTVAASQSDMPISQARLQLWPEYDDPGLLVIYSGRFADDTGFPKQVTFQIPAEARNIQTTVDDPQKGLLVQPFEFADGNLTYELPLPSFHIEYYLDRPPSGDQRDITESFIVPYPTQAMTVTVQQPARATNFSVTPKPGNSYQGGDGLTYYDIGQTNLQAGDRLDIRLAYTKADNVLTAPRAVPAESFRAEGALGNTSAAPSSRANGPTQWLPWLLIGLGAVVLVAGGLYWLLSRNGIGTGQGRLGSPRAATIAKAQATVSSAGQPAAEAGTVYCTQCGRRFNLTDRYCANCGAPRRS